MDAAGEVQRLLQLVRSRMRHRSGPHHTKLSYQHFVSDDDPRFAPLALSMKE